MSDENAMSGSGTDRSETPYKCFDSRCSREFDSLDDMAAVPGEGDRSPRHFCDPCADSFRRGPPLTDGGIAVGSYEDLGADRGQPVDRNPSLACEICGESFNWQDYWKDRILSADDPEEAPLWCDDCEGEIQTIRRRLSNNSRITDWNSQSRSTGTQQEDHDA